LDAITPLDNADRSAAVATITAAFADDPVERWLWPADELYERSFPDFVVAFGGPAFAEGTVWGLDGAGAVAVWLAPGREADEDAVVSVLTESVAPEQHEDLYSVVDQMATAHPSYPHWYLPWLAVKPARQGQGLGAKLLAHCLEIVDADGLPVFLETPNPRTVPLYERHGFEVVATAQAGACPPMTSMLRA
jgi:ribosomal protein S18 acetylase RimI-like enzyme